MKKAQIVDLFGRILLVILLALALLALDMAFAQAAPAGEKKPHPGVWLQGPAAAPCRVTRAMRANPTYDDVPVFPRARPAAPACQTPRRLLRYYSAPISLSRLSALSMCFMFHNM